MTWRILGLMFFIFSSTCFAKHYQIICPSEIDVTEKLTHSYQSWNSMKTPYRHFLNSISLYVGEPKELAMLKPDIDISNKTTSWKFSANDSIFMVCGYQGTYIQLYKSLPKSITGCKLLYKHNVQSDKGHIPDRLTCH